MSVEYKTAAQWRTSLGNATSVNPLLKIQVDILEQLEQLNAGGGGGSAAQQLYFTAAPATNDYTSATVPTLANMVGKTITVVTMAGSVTDPSLYSWDGTTFSLDPAITVEGGEFIVIFYTA